MRYYALLIFMIIPFPLHAQDSVRVVRDTIRIKPPELILKEDIESIIDSYDFGSAQIGISVLSLRTGGFLYQKNADQNFVPASTQKLLTSAAALSYLGADFRYSTSVYIDSLPGPDGVYNGNIYIKGTGDPTLSEYYMEDPLEAIWQWVDVLDTMGIKAINGYIIGDDNYFDDISYGPGWCWDDFNYSYSAQINALNIFNNTVELQLQQGDTIDEPGVFSVVPDNNYISIINKLKTVGPDMPDDIQISRDRARNIIEITGQISYDSLGRDPVSRRVTIENPTMYMLHLFHEELNRRNIRFRGALLDADDWNSDINYSTLRLTSEYFSPPLSEILVNVNTNSHNLSAELLLKTIGREVSGEGSFEAGAGQVLNYAATIGIAPDNVSYVDGSGLSRQNLISPNNIVALMSAVCRSNMREIMLNSMARPGREGTLKRRMKKSLAEKKVIAKTGSMNHISNICGVVTSRDGEDLVFAIMIQNFQSPQSTAANVQDLICMRLASFTRKRF